MTEPGHDGLVYELTGPEAHTLGTIASELGRATGKPVVYEDETLEEAYASRAKYNAPDWELEGWITTYLAIGAGELGRVTDDIARLTGHQPTSVAEFLDRS